LKILALLALHVICLFFLWLLWEDKNAASQRGTALTKMGYVTKKKSPRLFQFSVWVDFVIFSILYLALVIYSIWLLVS